MRRNTYLDFDIGQKLSTTTIKKKIVFSRRKPLDREACLRYSICMIYLCTYADIQIITNLIIFYYYLVLCLFGMCLAIA